MRDYRYYFLDQKEKQKYYVVCVVVLLLIGMLFYQNIILSVLLSLLCIPGQKYYEKSLAEKKQAELNVQFKDLLYSLSASFQAGRQMVEALMEGLDNLKLMYPPDAPIVVELEHIKKSLGEHRESEEEVLYDFARRSASEDIVNFVDVYFTCRTTGGDIQRVIMQASEIIIDKLNIEKEINTLTSQKKYEAKILTLIPVVILFFLQLTSPEYIENLYVGLTGRLLMTVAIAAIAVAYFWSMKITDIKV